MHSLLLLFAREQADRDEPEAGRKAAIRRMLDCYLATRIFAELEDDLWEYVSIGVLGGFTIRPASQPHSITWGSPTPIKGTSPPRSIAWTRA